MDSGGERDIDVSKGILIIEELFGGSHILWVVGPGVDESPENFLGFLLDGFLISHLGGELLDFDENFLDIDPGHKEYISIVLFEFDNFAQIIFIDSFLDSNIGIFPKLGLFNLLDHE